MNVMQVVSVLYFPELVKSSSDYICNLSKIMPDRQIKLSGIWTYLRDLVNSSICYWLELSETKLNEQKNIYQQLK